MWHTANVACAGRDYAVTHGGIITGCFAEYSYDDRHSVLLNPQALSVHEYVCECVCVKR